MDTHTEASDGASAALIVLGILLVLIGFAVPILFLAGVLFGLLGIVVHVLTPHHTHVFSSSPEPAAGSSLFPESAAGSPCPRCGSQ